MRAQILLILFKELGLPPLEQAGGSLRESLIDYQRRHVVLAAHIAQLSAATCVDLATAFGTALEFSIETGSGAALTIDAGLLVTATGSQPPTRSLVEPVLRELTEYGEDGTLRLRIDKRVLLDAYRRQATGDASYVTWHIFLFTELFAHFLIEGGLEQIDRDLFAGTLTPTVIALDDARDVDVDGAFLRIVSEDKIRAVPSLNAPVPDAVQTHVTAYRQALTDRLNWDFQLTRLTPLHLLCQSRATRVPEIEACVAMFLFHLSVMFTANRTERQGDSTSYTSSFLEQDRAAKVRLSVDNQLSMDGATLEKFARWTYSGEGRNSDRLTVLRTLFAQSLHEPTPQANTARLIQELARIMTEVQRQYDLFITSELDKYFEQRQAAADYVADTAKKVSDSVDALTKGLTDILLTTVAAVVAALIAALTTAALRGVVFTIALCAYAAYVLVQAGFRLLSTCDSLNLLKLETSTRLADLEDRLGTETYTRLRDRLAPRWTSFWRWWWITAIGYVIVAGLIIMLALWAPTTIALRQSPGPSPTVTPSVSRTPRPNPSPTGRATPIATRASAPPSSP